jgi:hypothetical protein
MKNTLFAIILVLISFSAFSQGLPPVKGVPLSSPDDYSAAENVVLQTSAYLLANPIDMDDESRLTAGVFIIRWMNGTPDFDFAFGQNKLGYIKNDVDLLSVYYATLSSFAIQNKSVKDPKTVTLNAVKKFIAYIKDPKNHVKMNRQLKKLADADEKGELKSYLGL